MASPPNSEVAPEAMAAARPAYYHLRDILDEYADAYYQYMECHDVDADRKYSNVMAQSVVTLLSYLRRWDDVKFLAVLTFAGKRVGTSSTLGGIQSGTPTHPTDTFGIAWDFAMQEEILHKAGLSSKEVGGHGDDYSPISEGEHHV